MKASTTDPLAPALAQARAELAAGIAASEAPRRLLRGHARALDAIIRRAWRDAAPGSNAALFATGGYGRRELYPGSDIDLAIVLAHPVTDTHTRLEPFIQRLWDLGLKTGASVRTLEETRTAAAADVATFTALTEARLLAGTRTLDRELTGLLASPSLWPEPAYREAKRAERAARHARYDDSTQRLEPSIKEGPGGLRDWMTLAWLGARHLGQRQATLGDIEKAGLITPRERRQLGRAWRIFSRLRLGLHYLSERGEDRLLFDLQPRLADLLNYPARPGVLAVERMMQDYYRAATAVARINALVFQSLAPAGGPRRELEPGLVAEGSVIDFDGPDTLDHSPELALGIFRRWQDEPALSDLAAGARRRLASSLKLVDSRLHARPEQRTLFASILSAPSRVAPALRIMHETGVLDRYLPAFARITGRMQYDLFHIFTVDEHVLHVVANVEALREGRFAPARPDLKTAAVCLDQPGVIYFAALFHDIAKGRGGDHSQLGAREARRFARAHDLPPADAELVAWLVRHHLSLSVTAQKSDLSDPRVITDFARLVGDQRRLDYLYVLTAADVQATNPALWNAWRGTLFGELYQATSRALWRGLEHPLDAAVEIATHKRAARMLLGGGNPRVTRLWNTLGDDYFLQYSADQIAWHTRLLLGVSGPPAVFLRPNPDGAGTAIAAYASRRTFAFARITAGLAQLGLTIVAARCVPVGRDETLDTYVVLEADGTPIEDTHHLQRAQDLLVRALGESAGERRGVRPTPRQVRLFATPTRVECSTDIEAQHTVLELYAGDRPGLLAAVARAFRRREVYLRTARIMTVGERAEDVFHITDAEGRPLDSARRETLIAAVEEEIAAEV